MPDFDFEEGVWCVTEIFFFPTRCENNCLFCPVWDKNLAGGGSSRVLIHPDSTDAQNSGKGVLPQEQDFLSRNIGLKISHISGS